jgi:hypothetical protein
LIAYIETMHRNLCLAVYSSLISCYIVSGFTPLARRIKVESDAELFAISPGGSGKRDKTAIESAVNVEWEPMSELDRRIEDGVHYEHDYCKSSQKKQRKFATKEEMPVARGIFCGYRCTPEEYRRLKSADPKDRE